MAYFMFDSFFFFKGKQNFRNARALETCSSTTYALEIIPIGEGTCPKSHQS